MYIYVRKNMVEPFKLDESFPIWADKIPSFILQKFPVKWGSIAQKLEAGFTMNRYNTLMCSVVSTLALADSK